MNDEIHDRFKDAMQYDAMISKAFCGYATFPWVLLSYLGSRMPTDGHLLDVGCGTGTSLVAYALKMPGWSLTGIDPAETMCGLAQTKIDETGLNSRITLQAGTIDVLPADTTFDGATLLLVEHLLPDDGTKLKLLQGIARRLKQGGWLALMGLYGDFATPETQTALDAWQEYLKMQGFSDEMCVMFKRRATSEDSLVSKARICALLTEAGFTSVEPFYRLHLVGGWLAQRA